MSGQDIFNFILILGSILLWVLRYKKSKEFQIYAFGYVKKIYFVMFFALVVIFAGYLNFLFALSTGENDMTGSLVITNSDGEVFKPGAEIDTSEVGSQEFTYTFTDTQDYLYKSASGLYKDDNGKAYTAETGIPNPNSKKAAENPYVDPNGIYLKDGSDEMYTYKDTKSGIAEVESDFSKAVSYDSEPVSQTVTVNVVDGDAESFKQEKLGFKHGEKYRPKFEVKYSNAYVNVGDKYTFKDLSESAGVKLSTSIELSSKSFDMVMVKRDALLIPFPFATIPAALLLASLMYHFVFFSKPVVKAYLDELYNINKFCGFLSYNMSYRANARVLIEDTLSSIDDGQFKEDFALIFFEKDRSMQERMADISNIYTFKFLEMFLGISAIVFEEGPSDSTIKSLGIIQQLGDDYYTQADLFFRTKAGAVSQLQMIIIISALIPAMVKVNIGFMYVDFVNTGVGFQITCGFYIIIFGIIVIINNLYRNNKIIRKEGRYV